MKPALHLRPIAAEDAPFLFAVYASTREEELASVPWSPDQKRAFLEMQFRAQHTHYQSHFPKAAYQVVLVEGQPVGRLYVERSSAEIRILDISLLPAHRRKGFGTALLKELITEANQTRRSLGIHVEKFNPALNLYQRLGFRTVADEGIYYRMERLPAGHGQISSEAASNT